MPQCPDEVKLLIERFEQRSDQVRAAAYNETTLRVDFINPLFRARAGTWTTARASPSSTARSYTRTACASAASARRPPSPANSTYWAGRKKRGTRHRLREVGRGEVVRYGWLDSSRCRTAGTVLVQFRTARGAWASGPACSGPETHAPLPN
jgi:hypothetical protein